jgi:hypothetical protein
MNHFGGEIILVSGLKACFGNKTKLYAGCVNLVYVVYLMNS